MTLLVVPTVAGVVGGSNAEVEAAAKRLAAAGVPAYEARQQMLRGVPFLIATDVERARGVAVELRGLGVAAWAVDEHALATSPKLDTVRSFRLFPEGIEVTTRPPTPHTWAVRWPAVQLVLVARSVQSSVTTSVKTTQRVAFNPMKMMKGPKRETDRQRDESEERFALVLCQEPDVLLRFDLEGLDFTGLGEQRQTVARANYEALVAHVKASASAARVDDRLEKLASRLSGAPAGVSTSASTAGLTNKVARSVSEDNEGAVVAAARLLCLAERLRRAG